MPLAWLRWLRAVETGSPEADAIGHETLARHRHTTVVGLRSSPGSGHRVGAGRYAGARGRSGEAVRPPVPPFRAVVAHAQALAGDLPTALRLLGEDLDLGGDYGALAAGCLAVEVLRMAGDDRLGHAVEQIRPFAHEVATYGSVQSFGSTALFVGSGLLASAGAATRAPGSSSGRWRLNARTCGPCAGWARPATDLASA